MSDQLVTGAATYTTYIHALSGIRTRDPSNQAVEDIRLRPHGHRHSYCYVYAFLLLRIFCSVYFVFLYQLAFSG